MDRRNKSAIIDRKKIEIYKLIIVFSYKILRVVTKINNKYR